MIDLKPAMIINVNYVIMKIAFTWRNVLACIILLVNPQDSTR